MSFCDLSTGQPLCHFFEWLQAIPLLAQLAVLSPIFLAIWYGAKWLFGKPYFFQLLGWLHKIQTIRLIRRAVRGPGKPAVRPDAPRRVFVPPATSVFDRMEAAYQIIAGSIKGERVERKELVKTHDTADIAYNSVLLFTGETHGLHFLPVKVRDYVQLKLMERAIIETGIADEALNRVQRELDSLGRNALVDALFSRSRLAKVDLTRSDGAGEDYFTKYFQSLMVAFAESRFSGSGAGTEEQEALLQHLKLLSLNRLRAARLVAPVREFQLEGVLSVLPKQIPSGYAKGKKAIEVYNKKDAILSVILVAEDMALEYSQACELRIDQAIRKSGTKFEAWTPPVEADFPEYIFFWQATG